MPNFKYRRVLLKLSGEALKGDRDFGYSPEALAAIAGRLGKLVRQGLELAIVVGAGNLWRGRMGKQMDRVTADHMGMLATTMNALALKDAFHSCGVTALVQASSDLRPYAAMFERDTALQAITRGEVIIFAGGTGNPYFTTDTAATVRALEINCDAVLKATKVNGVYSANPDTDPAATRFERLTFDRALELKLGVMDQAAFSLCRENNLNVLVFNFSEEGSLEKILAGDFSSGTLVSCD